MTPTWWDAHPEHDPQLRAWLGTRDDDREVVGALADALHVASVLEIGPGLFLDHERVWAARPHVAYEAVDATERFVRAGRARGLRVTQGAAEALPCGDRTVDLVYCRDVLEHLAHWRPALDEMLRVARRAVAVRFFRLAPSASADVLAVGRGIVAGLPHNTYARGGIEAHLAARGVRRWAWTGFRAHEREPHCGTGWLTVEVPPGW